jgi:hypothetical protein
MLLFWAAANSMKVGDVLLSELALSVRQSWEPWWK